ncbi:ROK family transcriptional regulator [Chitinophaga caseinilytica]|uniref:ROK family transcriptional regulator n=1 Tax=Chitinophaga caseinilytica TaxID=2267521 RepID=A0ABZ2Z3W2_9BACT
MSRHTFFEDLRNDAITGVAYKNLQQKKQVLSWFVNAGNTTIADLSRELNASVPKVGELINELIADGLVKDYGKIEAAAGRRPNVYGLEPDSFFFVGVDIKQYYVNLGLGDFRNNLVRTQEKVPFHLKNTPEALNRLCDIITEFIAASGKGKKKVIGIGVNLSGRINYRSGYSFSFFHFQEDPLSKVIEQRLGIPTFLENDSRAVAYGEFSSGAYHEKNAFFINLEHGIGMGLLLNGQLYYGKSGFAGDIGHIPVFDNEILCHCGKKGCLETEASGAALTRLFIRRLREGASSIVAKRIPNPDDVQLEDILAAVKQEDTLAIELIAEIGEKLGRGIAILINILNPEVVILGGALASTGDYILLPIRSAINKFSLTLVNNDTKLVLSRKGEHAGMAGACLLVRDRLLALID